MYEKTDKVHLKELLILFKNLASSGIHKITEWLDLLFKAFYQERKKRKERVIRRLACETLVLVVLSLFKENWYAVFSLKPS